MKGVHLDSDGWLPVVIGKPDWMSTIMLYGTEEGWKAWEQKKLSLEEHATSPVPADLARSSNSVTVAPADCTKPHVASGAAPRTRAGGSELALYR